MDHVSGGDPSDEMQSKFHPEIIAKYMDIVYTEIINQIIKTARGSRNHSMLDPYITPFENVPVVHDASRDEYYIQLPEQPIRIEGDKGIRLISAMKDETFVFVRRDNAADFIYSGLEVDHVNEYPIYKLEKDKLRLPDYERFKDVDKVLIKLVLAPSNLDEDDEIPVPDGRDSFFFEKIIQMLLPKRGIPEDEQNDGSSKSV